MNFFAQARALFVPDSSGFTPRNRADFCLAKARGISNTFEHSHTNLADTRNCVHESPIQHVWVGTGSGGSSGSGGGGLGSVTVSSGSPVAGNLVAVQ